MAGISAFLYPLYIRLGKNINGRTKGRNAINDAWETDNDADKDVNSLPDQFDGFRKGFLLE
jgi:hypothetical protein